MTIEEQIQELVKSVKALENKFAEYVKLNDFAKHTITTANNSASIQALEKRFAEYVTDLYYINKLTSLLDVNVANVAKGDLLQFDGDRWVNVKPQVVQAEQEKGITKLFELEDVYINSNLGNNQVLTWDNAAGQDKAGRWVNKSIESAEGFDESDMWRLLNEAGEQKINPTHINNQTLNLKSVTTTHGAELAHGEVALNVNAESALVIGNVAATGEIAAYTT